MIDGWSRWMGQANVIQGVVMRASELAIAHFTVHMVKGMGGIDGWDLINGWICQQLKLT